LIDNYTVHSHGSREGSNEPLFGELSFFLCRILLRWVRTGVMFITRKSTTPTNIPYVLARTPLVIVVANFFGLEYGPVRRFFQRIRCADMALRIELGKTSRNSGMCPLNGRAVKLLTQKPSCVRRKLHELPECRGHPVNATRVDRVVQGGRLGRASQ
jgi:hypothetical protein